MKWLMVGLGGFLGAISRYGISMIPIKEPYPFPFKTFFINVLGSLVLIFLTIVEAKYRQEGSLLFLMLKIGFCGAFTTFSTFAFEVETLIRQGKIGLAGLYLVLSIGLSVSVMLWMEYKFITPE